MMLPVCGRCINYEWDFSTAMGYCSLTDMDIEDAGQYGCDDWSENE